jgi:endogenous inhibitor of DNA gyrase (YacG/DUF329 family)
MPADPPRPVVFPCPTCKRFVSVDPADRKIVRPAGKRGELLVVRIKCPVCKQQIVRSLVK